MLKLLTAVSLLTTIVNAWSPTDSYAPGIVDCPDYLDDKETSSQIGFLRKASTISDDEFDWIESRDNITVENLKVFLNSVNLTDLDTDSFIDDIISNSSARIPRIALSFSGGGYRALLCAAGQISGLDNRTVGTSDHGLPILDSVSYISGLSGGSWFLSSLVFNNWTSVQEIIDQNGQDDAIWNFEHKMIDPYGINIVKDAEYWDNIKDDVDIKRDAGFNVSMTDPWGRGLSHQFFPGLKDYGASMTFTSLRDWEVFTNHSMPFPIIVADGRTPGNKIINLNSTVFEFNPFELGSWDTYVDSFVDLKYVGTEMDGGKVSGNGSCWAGLDNTGFVFGTSSTLFNQFLLQLNSTSLSGLAYSAAKALLTDLDNDDNDIAPWFPNPFYNSPWGSSKSIKTSNSLDLVDGGEDDQNVPLYPLLAEDRGVDVIFAFDNSADTDQYWPNGASLVNTYERQFVNSSANFAFPYVPGIDTFLHNNLTAKPTFFGCYASNLTDLMDEVNTTYVPPLVIYNANRPWTFESNTSTFKLKYSDEDKLSMIQNGFAVSTFNNLTVEEDFSKCVACAILQRSKERAGIAIGDECKACFDYYCWDGDTYTYTDDSYPTDFTKTGRYNNTVSTPNKSEEFELKASDAPSAATADVVVSSTAADARSQTETATSATTAATTTATHDNSEPSSTSTISVSSISTSSKNGANGQYSSSNWVNLITVLFGYFALI